MQKAINFTIQLAEVIKTLLIISKGLVEDFTFLVHLRELQTTHPKAAKNGHRTFKNIQTGEKLRYDEAKLGESGHKGKSHWYRHNPNSTMGDQDKYLNAQGVPVAKDSPEWKKRSLNFVPVL